MNKVICEIVNFSQNDVVFTSPFTPPPCDTFGGGTTCGVADD